MFKCKECAAVYDTKPDYCDCGNDSFDEVASEAKTSKASPSERVYIEPSYKKELPSIIFLVACIILSFVILFFIGNPKQEPKEVKKEEIKRPDIPDIDKLWNDEKPKYVAPVKKVEPEIKEIKELQVQKIIAEPKPQNKQEIVQVQKPKTVTQQKPVTQKTQSKPVQQAAKPVTKTTQTKPATQTTQQKTTQTKPTTQTKTNTQTTQPIKQTQPVKQTQPTKQTQPVKQTQPTQTTQSTQTTQTTVKQPTQVSQSTVVVQKSNPEELKQYKKALRNKIASNIDFLNIAGDGKCSLTFSVNNSGVLTNKKFVSQSSNTSLNDEVYSAMMKVNTFKTPPSDYKNEPLKLTVSISGGNFAVSLE